MSEWLDGYWTAIRQVAFLKELFKPETVRKGFDLSATISALSATLSSVAAVGTGYIALRAFRHSKDLAETTSSMQRSSLKVFILREVAELTVLLVRRENDANKRMREAAESATPLEGKQREILECLAVIYKEGSNFYKSLRVETDVLSKIREDSSMDELVTLEATLVHARSQMSKKDIELELCMEIFNKIVNNDSK